MGVFRVLGKAGPSPRMNLQRQNSTKSVRSDASTKRTSVNGKPKPSNANAIRVIARFRPTTDPSCVEELAPQHIRISGIPQPFVYDQVLDGNATQQEAFETCAKDAVNGVLAGYNGSVLAYGQTGSGKSHTMMGKNGAERGIIPRIVEQIFSSKAPDVRVSVTYMEIYNERVRDLLADPVNSVQTSTFSKHLNQINSSDLKIHENASNSTFYVKGLTQIAVTQPQQVYELINRGNQSRRTAATLMNQCSSRSHSVFTITVASPTTSAKLVLVDLAGSERVAKTGAKGLVLEEASNINRSLTSLGMVINALAHNQTASIDSYVPFRDSKLTKVLQDSLAGNSRTSLILHCSPSVQHLPETVNTLRFGLRAKTVQTQALINFTPLVADRSNYALEVFSAQQQLNSQLICEQKRLLAQHRRSVAVRNAQREKIAKLRRELDSLNARNRREEVCLAQDIADLQPRVLGLGPQNFS